MLKYLCVIFRILFSSAVLTLNAFYDESLSTPKTKREVLYEINACASVKSSHRVVLAA